MSNIAKGKPAEFGDFIIRRRLKLLEDVEGFFDRSKSILDIGCGNGSSLLLIHDQYKHCHGVDITQSSLDEFGERIQKNGIKNCNYSLENVDDKFCEDQTFDRIISFEVLEHVGNDQTVANGMFDKLIPGGLMAISVPNKWWIFETHGAHLPILPWNRIPFFSWLPKPIHSKYSKARIYRKNDIKKILNKSGFEILEQWYITAPMDVVSWESLKWFLRGTVFKPHSTQVPILATSIMTICRKPVMD